MSIWRPVYGAAFWKVYIILPHDNCCNEKVLGSTNVMTYNIIHSVRLQVSGLKWPARQSMCYGRVWQPHLGGMALDDGDNVTININNKVHKIKAQTKQEADKVKTKDTFAILWHSTVFFSLPFLTTDWERGHWESNAIFSLGRWSFQMHHIETLPLPEGEAPHSDCGFTIGEQSVHVWKLPEIPAGRNSFLWTAMFPWH